MVESKVAMKVYRLVDLWAEKLEEMKVALMEMMMDQQLVNWME
jgi:hypothetical protein